MEAGKESNNELNSIETRQTVETEMEEVAASSFKSDLPTSSLPMDQQHNTTGGASTNAEQLSSPQLSSPGSGIVALPSAAQPLRHSTPKLRSRSPLPPPSSESSSGETILCTSSRARRQSTLKPELEQDENGSDDSLRLLPVGSSVSRSASGGGTNARPPKTRKTSALPQDPTGKGGGSAAETKDNSSTSRKSRLSPSPSGNAQEIDQDLSDSEATMKRKGVRGKKSRTQQLVEKEQNQDNSEDDLDFLSSSQASTTSTTTSKKRKDRRSSGIPYVDVPAPLRPPLRSTAKGTKVRKVATSQPSATTVSSPAEVSEERVMGEATIEEDTRKRRKKDHEFEEETDQSSARTSPLPFALPGSSSQPASPPRLETSEAEQPSDLATIKAMLAENEDGESSAPSSPLTSVPASSPPRPVLRTETSPPPSTTTASKRPLSPSASDDKMEGLGDLSTPAKPTTPSEQGSPKKKARVPKVSVKPVNSPAASTSASASNATKKKKQTRSTAGRAGSRGKKKLDEEVPKGEETETEKEEEGENSEVESGNGWGTRPNRRKAARRSLRETSSPVDGDDSGQEEEEETDSASASESLFRSSPAKKTKTNKKPRATTSKAKTSPRPAPVKKGRKKEPVVSKSKSKDKGKGKAKAKESTGPDAAESGATASSSPAKSALRATSSFLFDMSQPSTSSRRETTEERARDWDVREFDDYVWVHVSKNEDREGFWWIATIKNKLRSERPLSLELFLDQNQIILKYSSFRIIDVAEPSSDNLLKFRSRYSPTSLRFTRETFQDSDASDASDTDLSNAFVDVLQQALQRESSFGDDSDSDLLPDPSQLATSQRSKRGSQRKRDSSSEEEQEERVEEADSESEDESMKEKDEVSSFPFYCLAKERNGWWAATCVGYSEGAKPAKGRNGPKQKFKIEFPSGETSNLPRSSLLFSRQKQFSTVQIQETTVEFNPQYLESAIAFIKKICTEELRLILNEQYPPAQSRNDQFFAGGREREQLAQTSVFGELPSNFIDEFSDTITTWLLPKNGVRPKGSTRYEALTDLERVRYIADVLLPAAIVLNYIDDLVDAEPNLEERARKAFEEAGNSSPSQGELDSAMYELAYKALNSRSATKAVKSMREGRKAAQSQVTTSRRSRR
ncbi:hypothetical protein JCM3765_001728 [Sporobolomyces pararoseus]